MPSALKVSRRPRTLLLVASAFFCTYLLSGLFVPFPSSYSNLEQQADQVNTPPAQRKPQAITDSKASFPSEEFIEKHDHNSDKIGKISMLYGDPNPTYERALKSHINHANLHNYPLFILRQKLLDRLWSKPAYIMSVLLLELSKPDPTSRLDWLFWFDADTYLLNQKLPLEIFLPPAATFPHIHLTCSNDHNGLNDGAFFLRVNDWSLHLMAAAISLETLLPKVPLKYSEQSAIEHLTTSIPYFINHTAIVPQRWTNAFMGPREWDGRIKANKQIKGNSVQEGDLLVHFAGNGQTKKARMTRFMNAFEKNRAAWELEANETEIVGEMKEFWEVWARVERERERGVEMHASIEKNAGERGAADSRADQRFGGKADELDIEHRLRRRW